MNTNNKVLVTGPHGSGKSTLVTELGKLFPSLLLIPEPVRKLNSCGFLVNENGTETTQILIQSFYLKTILTQKNFIADRGLVDGYVYADYLFSIGQVSKQFRDFTYYTMMEYAKLYNHILYVPSEFPLVDDSMRSLDLEFHSQICQRFENTLPKLGLSYYTIRGSLDFRLKRVQAILTNSN